MHTSVVFPGLRFLTYTEHEITASQTSDVFRCWPVQIPVLSYKCPRNIMLWYILLLINVWKRQDTSFILC